MTFHPFIQTQDMQDTFENTHWVKAKTNANNVVTRLLNHAIRKYQVEKKCTFSIPFLA